MSASTYSVLQRAFTNKTPSSRNDNWVKFQKEAKLKDKGILKQVKKAVENGVSEKRAHDLITVIYSSKKRKMVPDFDAPSKNFSLKSSKTSSKSNRFERAEKRKSDEKVLPRKKYIEDEYQHFPIFSQSKVVAWIGDDVMKFVLAGDYKEVENRLSSKDAFRTQDGKIRDEALKSTEFASFVRNSMINTTKAIYKLQTGLYKNAEIIDLCKKISGYANLLQQGKAVDFFEVGDVIKRLNSIYSEINNRYSEAPALDSSSHQGFANMTANIITDRRIHEEDINQLEEAVKNCEELEIDAEEEAEEEAQLFKKARIDSNLTPQAGTFDQDMKKKKEGEILQAQHAKSYRERKTKAENFKRFKNLNKYAIHESRKNWANNTFNETFIKSIIQYCDDSEKIYQIVLHNFREQGLSREDSVNQALAVMPELLSYLQKVSAEEKHNLTPKEDYDVKVNYLEKAAKEKYEEAAQYEATAADSKENIEVLSSIRDQNARNRVDGVSDESGAAVRQKIQEQQNMAKNATQAAAQAKREGDEFSAQAAQEKAERANVERKAESVKQTVEQASALGDQRRIYTGLSEENINETTSFVDSFNNTTKEVKRFNLLGESIVRNQAKEEPIKDIKESDYSKIVNDEQHYDGTLNDQIQIIRHAIQRYIDRRDHLPVGHNEIPWINNMLSSLEDIVAHYESLRASQTANSLRQQGYSVDVKTEQALKDVFRDQDMRQDPRYGAQAQQRVLTTADVKIEPSIEKTLINLQVPQYQQRNDLLNIPLSVRSSFDKKPVTPKKYKIQGGFTVGSRPDPFINRAYWKNVYQRLNK